MQEFIINVLSGLAIVSYLSIGVYILRAKQPISFSLSLISFGSFFWGLGIFLFRLVPFNLPSLWALNALFIVSSSVIANAFVHFSLVFSQTKKEFKLWQLILNYLPSVVVAVACFIPNILITDIVQHSWGKESIIGDYYFHFGLYIIGSFLVGSNILIWKFFTGNKSLRPQLISVVIATSITGGIDIYYNLILVLLGNYKYVWVGPLSSFIWVTCLVLSISKFDLLKHPLVITRAAARTITFMLLATSFLVIHPMGLRAEIELLFYFILLVFWSTYNQKIRMYFLTTLQKKFVKGIYNTEEIISNLSSVLIYQQDYDSVMKTIAMEFINQLELSGSYILIKDTQKKHFDIKNTQTDETLYQISNDHPFIEYCQNKTSPFMLSDIPSIIQESIEKFNFDPSSVGFAVHSFQEVQGIFILNQKLTEEPFTKNDFKLLSTVTNQIIVVFERISKEKELAEVNVALQNLNNMLEERVKEKVKEIAIANAELKDLNDTLEEKVESQVKEIEEKRKIEKDLEMSSTIQRSVLPKCSPKINNYLFHASFYPSRKIGGDYYNFFPFSEHEIGILLCDVAGKGISSAIMMMELHAVVHRLIKPDLSPNEFMFQLNNAIVNNQIIKKQVAVFYGILNNETHTLNYCNGGHDEGYLFTGTHCLRLAESSGLSPGFMEDQDYKNEMTSIKNGDALMIFTDGLTDVESSEGEKYGLDSVLDVAKAYRTSKGSFETLGQAVVAEWKAFKADSSLQKDDMTVITIEHERLPLFVPSDDEL